MRKGTHTNGLESYSFTLRKSAIQGHGVFTLSNLPARRKIGEITGTLVRLPQARRAVERTKRIYMVELTHQWALDCSRGNELGHINHSCEPNCYLRIIRMRVEMYALVDIPAGAELTIDYGETPHIDGMKCSCNATACRGHV
ncbi:MAG: SET domain-containing protein-lysine N-methyltransferase [Candidatus Hydrogenedentes bacterium]|nr:SET domain-containing protein-lysine N-methyltransferase [Candidatus Hydrogenedentota bacterium]